MKKPAFLFSNKSITPTSDIDQDKLPLLRFKEKVTKGVCGRAFLLHDIINGVLLHEVHIDCVVFREDTARHEFIALNLKTSAVELQTT